MFVYSRWPAKHEETRYLQPFKKINLKLKTLLAIFQI
jgi:hypothetical protein